MKHISFSLFGYDLKYYIGAEKNIVINKELLPDWTTVIYYHPENILQGYVEKLTEMGAAMIDVSNMKLVKKNPYIFHIFGDFYPSYKIFQQL